MEARKSLSKLSVWDTFRYKNTTKIYRLFKNQSPSEIVDGKVPNEIGPQNLHDITPRLVIHRAHAKILVHHPEYMYRLMMASDVSLYMIEL